MAKKRIPNTLQGKASFNELTADQLLELWHKIDPKKEMLGEIFRMLD